MGGDRIRTPQEGAAAPPPRKPFDAIGMARRHGLLVLALGLAIFLALAPLARLLSRTHYEAQGRLEIARVVQPLLAPFEREAISNFFQDYARTQVLRIGSPHVLRRAVERVPPELRQAYAAPAASVEGAAASLEKMLEVKQVFGSHIISLALQGRRPQGLAETVNAVMDAFMEQALEDEARSDANRIRYLESQRDGFALQAVELGRELADLAAKAGTSTFTEDFNLESQKLSEVQKAYAQAFADMLAKGNAFRELKTQVERLQALPIDSLADDLVAKDESLWNISSWTYRTLQEMRATIDGSTADNPDRRYVEDRMKAMQDYESSMKGQVGERALRIVAAKRDYELGSRLIQAEHEWRAAASTEEELRKRMAELRGSSEENSRAILRGQEVSARLQSVRDQIARFDVKISELAAESQSPLRVSVQAPALAPLEPSGSNVKKLLAFCLVLAFGGVGALFLGAEFLDGRIRSPKDLSVAVGGPVSWPLSHYSGGPFHRLTLDAPGHPSAKAVRSLALKIHAEHEEHGAKVVVFSGVDRRVGVTGLLVNTAHALTTFTPRVLVVEANLAGGGLGEVLGLERPEAEMEMADGGVRRFADALLEDRERRLAVLLMDGRHWTELEGAEVGGVLDGLREAYDLILVDTAPLLESDFTEFLARRADLVVLMAQGDLTTYGRARFAAELLVWLRVKSVATVLNWGAPRLRSRLDKLVDRIPFAHRLVLDTRRV